MDLKASSAPTQPPKLTLQTLIPLPPQMCAQHLCLLLQHPSFCAGKAPSLISKAIQVLLVSRIPGLIPVPAVVSYQLPCQISFFPLSFLEVPSFPHPMQAKHQKGLKSPAVISYRDSLYDMSMNAQEDLGRRMVGQSEGTHLALLFTWK